jgi:hypothetical protein
LKKIIIISGIIPATFNVYLCIVELFIFLLDISNILRWSSFLVVVICILGISGYVGLWKSLITKSNDKRLVNLVLLIAGILSVCLTLLMVFSGKLPMRINNFPQDIGRLIVVIWPGIVSIFVIASKKRQLNLQK